MLKQKRLGILGRACHKIAKLVKAFGKVVVEGLESSGRYPYGPSWY